MQIIGGKFRGRKLNVPKNDKTRPTSGKLREAFFNICKHSVQDARFLDLFAGSGAMGLEALSRGAQWASFVEIDKEAFLTIKANIDKLSVKNSTQVLFGNALKMLGKLSREESAFDIIFADPPYETYATHEGHKLFLSQCILQIIEKSNLLATEGSLFIEDTVLLNSYGTLQLKDARKFGSTFLHQFQKI